MKRTYGPDDPTVAAVLSKLAGLLENRGDYTGAEPLYRRALAIDEKVFGPDHPRVAEKLTSLAGLLIARATMPVRSRSCAGF